MLLLTNQVTLMMSQRDGPKFEYTTLDDGTTVIKKSLLNGYIMSGNCYPIVLCICDCSEHLQSQGKGHGHILLSANVQKAGRVSRFPCTTTLYEREHALAS